MSTNLRAKLAPLLALTLCASAMFSVATSASAVLGSQSSGGGSSMLGPDGRRVLLDLALQAPEYRLPPGPAGTMLKQTHATEDLGVDVLQLSTTTAHEVLRDRLANCDTIPSVVRDYLDLTLTYHVRFFYSYAPLAETSRYDVPADFPDDLRATIKTVIIFDPELGPVVHAPRWNELDALSQAGLVVHEALRRLQVAMGPYLSDKAIQDLTASVLLCRRVESPELAAAVPWLEPASRLLWGYLGGPRGNDMRVEYDREFDNSWGDAQRVRYHFPLYLENQLRLLRLVAQLGDVYARLGTDPHYAPLRTRINRVQPKLIEQIAENDSAASYWPGNELVEPRVLFNLKKLIEREFFDSGALAAAATDPLVAQLRVVLLSGQIELRPAGVWVFAGYPSSSPEMMPDEGFFVRLGTLARPALSGVAAQIADTGAVERMCSSRPFFTLVNAEYPTAQEMAGVDCAWSHDSTRPEPTALQTAACRCPRDMYLTTVEAYHGFISGYMSTHGMMRRPLF